MSSIISYVSVLLLVVALSTSLPLESSAGKTSGVTTAARQEELPARYADASSPQDDLKTDSTFGLGFGFGLPLVHTRRYLSYYPSYYPSYYGSYGYYNPYHYHHSYYGYPYYSYSRHYSYDTWPDYW